GRQVRAQDAREIEVLARRRVPGAPLPAATRVLRVGRDNGAVRRALGREARGLVVGGAAHGQVYALAPEPRARADVPAGAPAHRPPPAASSTSSARSTAGAEWVRAPAEMMSTPA